MKLTALFLFLLQLCFLDQHSHAQINNKNNNESSAINYVQNIYANSVSEQSGLYDGPEYTGYPYRVKEGHPFFLSNDIGYGDVTYKGMLYKNVPVKYDIAKNELLVRYQDSISMISLHNEKLSSFSIFSQQFVKVDTAVAAENNIPAGFYNQIYKGRSEVLVRRSKGTLKSIIGGVVSTVILPQKNELYLLKDGKYYRINREKSAVAALDNIKEVQLQLKQEKVKFRREPEKALVIMVSAYDKLKN